MGATKVGKTAATVTAASVRNAGGTNLHRAGAGPLLKRRALGCLWVVWLAGWGLHGWHLLHSASWDKAWNWARYLGANQSSGVWVGRPSDGQGSGGLSKLLPGVLDRVTMWGSAILFSATVLFVLYLAVAALMLRLGRAWSHESRVERLREHGRALEVIVPSGSKGDSAVMSRLLQQLWDHLAVLGTPVTPGTPGTPGTTEVRGTQGGVLSRGTQGPATGGARHQRGAISLEMLGTPEGVGFYIWLPGSISSGIDAGQVETLRDLIRAHYPGCRVRLRADRMRQSVLEIVKGGRDGEGELLWVDMRLRADSRYPLASGGSGSGRSVGQRGAASGLSGGTAMGRPVRASVGGAAADPLGGLLSLLAAEKALPLIGVQIIVSAHAEAVQDACQQIREERAQLRDMEVHYGRKSLGREHDERVTTLEEKDDEYGYDTQVRLVALATGGREASARADARLEVLLKSYRLYNRTTAGVTQGFVERARGRVRIFRGMNSWQAGAVLGRWHREGLDLPRWLPSVWRSRAQILNCEELAAVYHFPHEGLEKIGTVRVGDRTHLPAPEFAMATTNELATAAKTLIGTVDEDMPTYEVGTSTGEPAGSGRPNIGHLAQGTDVGVGAQLPGAATPGGSAAASLTQVLLPAGKRAVGLTQSDLTRGLYVLGSMGSGKSGMMLIKIYQHLLAGEGVGLIDPKTDLYNEVILRIPPERERDVILFDPSSVGRQSRVVGLNPLDARTIREVGAARVSAKLMDLIKKVMGASWDTAVRMRRFLLATVIAVIEAEMAVGRSPTLMSIYRCLKDEDGKGGNSYRESLLPYVTNPIALDFWRVQFPAMGAQQRQSLDTVLTRIEKFVLDDLIRSFVAQPASTLNAREIMDRRGIFLANITSEESKENQVFLGAIITNMFLLAAMSRRDVPQWAPSVPGGPQGPGGPEGKTLRPYFHLHLDEFQNFVATEAEDIETMLSMCRAFHLCLTIAHQYTGQLPQSVMDAISSNVQTMVLFGLQGPDAPRFSSMFPEVRTQDWLQLPLWHSYQRAIVDGHSTKGLYSAGPLNLPPLAPNSDSSEGSALTLDAQYETLAPLAGGERAELLQLAHDDAGQSESERAPRLQRLAERVWRPADCGEIWVANVLSLLSGRDFELYRRIRVDMDRAERLRLLAKPGLVADKKGRIERLSALLVGTPQVEVDAWVHRMTRGHGSDNCEDDGGNRRGEGGGSPARRTASPKY